MTTNDPLLDEAAKGEMQGNVETAAVRERSVVLGKIGNLADGDVFSLDQGRTWHTCAVVGVGTVSVYAGGWRADGALTIRLPAERGQSCRVRMAWTRLYDFDGHCYARTDCRACQGEGLVKVEPAQPGGYDTDNCRCVREAAEVPERAFRVLVQETSVQWAYVRVRALNEANIEGESAVRVGDGYDEEFTGREAIEIYLGSD